MKKISATLKNIFEKEIDFTNSIKIIALLSLFSMIFEIIVQNGLSEFCLYNYLGYFKSPLLLVFNFLPIFLFMMLFYFMFNSISKSFIIVNIPLTLLLIVNHYKIFFRDMPLTLNDFFTVREAFAIVQNYKLEFNFRIFISTFLMLLIFIFLIRFLNNKKNKIKLRIIGSLATCIFIVASYTFIYSNSNLYKEVSKPVNEFYDVDIVNAKGLIYSLLSKAEMKNIYKKPDTYEKERIIELINNYTVNSSEEKVMPNIIAIMSEAFFDITNASNIEFNKNKYPLENYNRLKKNANYGNIIVPGFAGATASTEFEFLTGLNISNIDSSMPDIYKTHINSKIYSIVDLLKSLNYKTLAIHPGFSWFYNRSSVYKYMGFDDMIFKSDLPNKVEQINYYVSDNVTSKLIIDNYKKHLSENENERYFNFTITIQNHGPYSDKPLEEPYISKPDNMDEKLYNIVNNYIAGLDDADQLLGDVTNYIDTLDEPTVVLFFGDHLPYFDSELKAYKEIEYPIYENDLDSLKLKYSTPYIIWGNKSFIKNSEKVLKGKNEDISSNYLAVKLLEYINMDLPPFFNFVNELENKISIISKDYYYINDEFKMSLSDEEKKYLDDYKNWAYYNLTNK